MLQRKVPQTLVYGVKQALTRSQQQSKNAADGSDLMAVKEHVQSSSSSSASSATTVKKFVGEVSGGVQLSNNFTIDAVANVSDAIVKAIGIDKLMEIASTNIELPDEQFIAHYGSLDFSQEEFDMFTSGSHHYSAAIATTTTTANNNNSTNNSHHSMALINTSAAVNNKSSTTATNSNNRTNMTSKMSSGPVVSSANSSVKFEDVTHRRENALNALTERILSGLKQLVTQLRQLLWNGSSVFSTAASSNSQELSASAAASNTTNQTRVKELTALGVIFAAAYAVDVILFRMFKNQMVSHSFRSNLMGTLRTMNF